MVPFYQWLSSVMVPKPDFARHFKYVLHLLYPLPVRGYALLPRTIEALWLPTGFVNVARYNNHRLNTA